MSVERRVNPSGKTVWRVRWREGGRAHSRVFPTLYEAEGFQVDNRRRMRQGVHGPVDASDETLKSWLEEWWSLKSSSWASTTKRNRGIVIDLWILPSLGTKRLKDLGTFEIESWHGAIQARGRKDLGSGALLTASPQTANKALEILSTALSHAVKARRLPSNPCRDVTRASVQRSLRRAMPLGDVERIRCELPTERDRIVWTLMAYAGLRPEEALALTWADVEPDCIFVERAYVEGELKGTKTAQGRAVNLLAPLAEEISAFRETSDTKGLVCPAPQGGYLDLRNWRSRIFRPAWQRAGLEQARPYDGRHVFASLLIHAGESSIYVASQMGHRSPTTTNDHYAHEFARRDLRMPRDPSDAIRLAREEARQAASGEGGVSITCPSQQQPNLRLVA